MQLRPRRGDRAGERGDDAALAGENALVLDRPQEADVFGQDAMLGLRAGVGAQEGLDQAPHAGLGRQLRRLDLGGQREQPGDVRLGDLDQQLMLVLHVVIQRRLGDAAGLGDLVHRGRRIAVSREQLGGAREDRLALQLVALGSSAWHR